MCLSETGAREQREQVGSAWRRVQDAQKKIDALGKLKQRRWPLEKPEASQIQDFWVEAQGIAS